jgi:hypothetical protein
MISLRLTAVEYESLRSLYPTYGTRSVSEFARLAMQRVIGQSPASGGVFADKIHELDDRLNAVEANVTLLLGRSNP